MGAYEQAVFFKYLSAEAEEEALQQYLKGFGLHGDSQPGADEPLFKNRKAFHWQARGDWDAMRLTNRSKEQVLAELDRDMAAAAVIDLASQEMLEPRDSGGNADSMLASNPCLELRPTFGYAGSLDKHPPFAKFDIRDHICLKVGGLRHGQVVRVRSGAEMLVVGVKEVEGVPRLWFQPKGLGRPGAATFRGTSLASLKLRVTALDQEPEPLREMKPEDFFAGEDPDGEEFLLCRGCGLPVGIDCYLYGDNKDVPVHGECLEKILLSDCMEVEREQKAADAAAKQRLRKEYDIGWKAWEVPRNTVPAMKLGCEPAPRGMCCLVFDEQAHSVQVAPTLDAAASVNLEYLSLALQVRLREGREPLFSLDAVDHKSEWGKDTMHAKRYEPEWLAGTSVGDVLFQADYHLKELSMGECEQPVVGMKSCIDLQEALESQEEMKEWSAREWFVVRKAAVLMNEDNVLIPCVKMGVEAREQVLVKSEEDDQLYLADRAMTRSNHPMVQYAKEFTRQFDLIAERKSVIYHLRDLAKASVLAKMLLEASVNMQETWLELAGEAKLVSALEVPQLWNDRLYSRIQTSSTGMEVLSDKDRSHGVYGGVHFGLQQQTISMPSQVTRGRLIGVSSAERPATAISAMTSPALGLAGTRAVQALGLSAMAPAPAKLGLPTFSASPTGGLRVTRPVVELGPGAQAVQPTPNLQMRFRQFVTPGVGISTITSVGVPAQRDFQLPLLEAQALFRGFLRPSLPVIGVEMLSSPEMFSVEETTEEARGVDLNLDQFNLSQPTRVQGHCLDDVREVVKRAPLGAAFWAALDAADANGLASLQESDWNLLQQIFNPNLSDRREEGDLFVPPDTSHDYVEKLRRLVKEEEEVREQRKTHFFSRDFSLACPGPLFPKSWEPSIEIASKPTLQSRQLIARPDYKAFSQKFEHALKSTPAIFDRGSEEGIRFRVYDLGNLQVRTTQEPSAVEEVGAVYSQAYRPAARSEASKPAVHAEGRETIAKVTEYIERANDGRRSYIVIETDQGCTIVTEKLRSGEVLWDEDASDLEFRNSLAKVMRSESCHGREVSVRYVKECCASQVGCSQLIAAVLQSKRYASYAYKFASGNDCELSGFYRRQSDLDWQFSEKKYGLYSGENEEEQEEDQESAGVWCEHNKPTLGDLVQVRRTSRVGKVVVYDESETPYKVKFNDGLSPQSSWYKESDLQRAQ